MKALIKISLRTMLLSKGCHSLNLNPSPELGKTIILNSSASLVECDPHGPRHISGEWLSRWMRTPSTGTDSLTHSGAETQSGGDCTLMISSMLESKVRTQSRQGVKSNSHRKLLKTILAQLKIFCIRSDGLNTNNEYEWAGRW